MKRTTLAGLVAAGAMMFSTAAVTAQSPATSARPAPQDLVCDPREGQLQQPARQSAAAQKAADDLGVDLLPAGPEGFDAEAQLKYVQDLFAAGGRWNGPRSIPGETMAAPLNQLIADGHPVVMFNIYSANINAPYVGENPIPAWSQIGALVADRAVGTDCHW